MMLHFLRLPSSSLEQESYRPTSPNGWSSQEVMAWVEMILGSKQYCSHFKKIRGRQLLELNEEALERLGLKKIGPRKKLYRSIQSLINPSPRWQEDNDINASPEDSDEDSDSGSSYAHGTVTASSRRITSETNFIVSGRGIPKSYSGPLPDQYLAPLSQHLAPPFPTPIRKIPIPSGGLPFPPSPPLTRHHNNNNNNNAQQQQQQQQPDRSHSNSSRQRDASLWSVSEVTVWLSALNLGEYQVLLSSEKIDGRKLLQVSDSACDISHAYVFTTTNSMDAPSPHKKHMHTHT